MGFSLGEYHDIFVEESEEYLENLSNKLLELENDPENPEIINEIFRIAHSIKGSSAFVGLHELSDLAHRMESLLQLIKDGKIKVTSDIIDILFECLDTIKMVIDQVSNGVEPERDFSELMGKLEELIKQAEGATPPKEEKGSEQEEPAKEKKQTKLELSSEDRKKIKDALSSGKSVFLVDITFEEDVKMKWIRAELILRNVEEKGEIIKVIPSKEELEKIDFDVLKIIVATENDANTIKRAADVDQVETIKVTSIKLKTEEKEAQPQEEKAIEKIEEPKKEEQTEEKVETPEEAAEREKREREEREKKVRKIQSSVDLGTSSKYVRVPVDRLDNLMNNIGELVIANSGLLQIYEELKNIYGNKGVAIELKNRIEQMARIAKELQEGIMKTRMVPIGQIFNRFVRMVRDLAKAFNKEVDLVMRGEDTELDKKVIDAIGEPIMHLIRNAIDHGIEPPEEREKLGKPRKAIIELNAYQSGNNIFVEIKDDGRGLDLEKIKEAAIKKGFVTEEELKKMSKADIYNLIFKPGFSTKDHVTDISGRGIGMNIVEEVVSRLNGSIRIQTKKGVGTIITLIFPLTLAIVTAVMVRVRDELYAIPLSDVVETIKITSNDIITIEGYEVIYLRDEIVSLVRLDKVLDFPEEERELEKYSVIVVNYGNKKVGLLADGLAGKQEIVIKSLDTNYKVIPGLSGASILGDGSIVLIIDVQKLIGAALESEVEFSAEALAATKQIIEAEEIEQEIQEVKEIESEHAEVTATTKALPEEGSSKEENEKKK